MGSATRSARGWMVHMPHILKQLRSFDREKSELCRLAAIRGKAPGFAAGREDAVARDDDDERITAERLSDSACRPGVAEAGRDVAVRERGTRRDRPCQFVNPTMEVGHALHVERDERQIG